MSPSQQLMAAAMQLSTAVDALAALGALARIEETGEQIDPAVRDLLDAVLREVAGPDAAAAPIDPAVAGLVRTLLALGTDLAEHPGRATGWDHTDAWLLQSIGRLSGAIAGAIATEADADPVLGAVLHRDGGTFLDVGTGTGWLAIAVAERFPNLQVTGIDVFEPALGLARANVAGVGMEDRVELRLQDAAALDEVERYDAVWLAMPFLPEAIVADVLRAAHRALRPGGVLLPGTFAGPDDRLAQLLVDLRTVRSGGRPWRQHDLCALLGEHGFDGARVAERRWAAPLELYVAHRP